jgi:hypothetical protein
MNGMMSPKAVLLDFEEALSEGFIKVFLNAAIQRDMFHFVQANVKQAGQLGLKTNVKEIVVDVNILWYASTKQEFDREVAQFLDKCDKREPSYSTYFRTNWLNRFPPETWASFGRPSDALSGCFRLFIMTIISFLIFVQDLAQQRVSTVALTRSSGSMGNRYQLHS